MVVVDKILKYDTFMPTTAGCTAKEDARLFLKNVVKYLGLPRHIISDWDPHFTCNFWRMFFEIHGMELDFSIRFHLQIDSQTEASKPCWSSI